MAYSHENLQNTIDAQQASNEELKSSNEELQSLNEEVLTVNADGRRQRAGDASGRNRAGCDAMSLPDNDSPLRVAAEAQLAAVPSDTPARPVADLLHELQANQIELEMHQGR